MAGAVSAGAYTGGVIDYLIETLTAWEDAKSKNNALGENDSEYDHTIPMHDVEIDVISGASAGGITGTLTLLKLLNCKNDQPINTPHGALNNLLYRSWVDMADDTTSDTFSKMLDVGDLEKHKIPESLLNTRGY